MTTQEKVLVAIEKIINQFGELRAEGVVADMWYKHMHDLRSAASNAYYEQVKVVEKQKQALTNT